MNAILTRPAQKSTVVLFDATRHRNRLAAFGLGLDAAFTVDEPQELEFESDACERAYSAGQRIGRARIDASKVSFHGWDDAAVSWFWSGYRAGEAEELDRRLEAQAELDRRYDAMYIESLACDDGIYGYE